MTLTHQQQQIMQNMMRNRFAALDTIELTIEGRQLINIAEEAGWVDLHSELCESYNERTKTNGAEDAQARGLEFCLRRLQAAFKPAA